jgi:proteic killer suppression protein
VIVSFRHKGLEALYEKDSPRGVQRDHIAKLKRILQALDAASDPQDLNIPGFELHPLKGDRKGEWAVTVRGNWRVTFSFVDQDVRRVNYEDYH